MRLFVLFATLSCFTSLAFADDLGDKMIKSCTKDMTKYCPDQTNPDAEAVWNCLEFKAEKLKKKISSACYKLHEKYEAQYHKKDSNEELSRMPAAGTPAKTE